MHDTATTAANRETSRWLAEPLPTNAVIDTILSRSAAKYYDSTATLSDEQIRDLVRIGTSAPTSFHLQNWRFIAVRKARLLPIAWNQPAITEAAVTFIIIGQLADASTVPQRLAPVVEAGIMPAHMVPEWEGPARGLYDNHPQRQRDEAVRSATFGAAVIVYAARSLGLGSTPMIGFDAEAVRVQPGRRRNAGHAVDRRAGAARQLAAEAAPARGRRAAVRLTTAEAYHSRRKIMPRAVALTPEHVPADSKPTLDMFAKNIGFTPNMMATFAQSPIAFNAWAALLGSLSKALDVKTRDSIGLTVSEVNGCDYCLTVHSFTAERMAKLPAEDIVLARKGHAKNPKRDAAVQFARKIIESRGHVTDADLQAVRDAGYTDANIMEIVALVAMYSLTNFFNNVFHPDKDFPAVAPAGSV